MNWMLLKNSLLLSGSATVLAMLLGFVAALCLVSVSSRWRGALLVGTILPLALPSFLIVDCWLQLLGHNGALRAWVPFDIYSLAGAAWVLALTTWPLTTFAVLAAWKKLDTSQFDVEPALRGASLLRWLLWPAARGAMTVSAAITFVLAMNNFAVPALLQVKVLPAEIWVRFSTQLKPADAWAISWPLIVAPAALLFLRGRVFSWPRSGSIPSAAAMGRQLGLRWRWGAVGVTMVLFGLSIVLPLAQLIGNPVSWNELMPAWRAGRHAVWNSFALAAGAATLGLLLGLVGFRVRIVGTVLWLPFLVPGVLLGIIWIAIFNRPQTQFIYQTSAIALIALTVRYVGLTWNGIHHAVQQCDARLTDMARIEGARAWQMLRYVYGPQIAPTAAALWYVVYLLCLWDVESLVLIVPPGGETAALRIFNLLHYGHTPQVNALCLWLIVAAIAPLVLGLAGKAVGLKMRAVLCGAIPSLFIVVGCDSPSAPHHELHSQFFATVEVIGNRGTGVGEFNKPRSVAVDTNDNLYVVDMTGRVQKFSPAGKFLGLWQMPETDKGKPKGMSRDRAGNIIVLEPHYSRVSHFTPSGQLVAQWGRHGTNDGALAFPRAIAVNSQGEIFASEYGLVERVQRFSAYGRQHLATLGEEGALPGQFNRPEGLGIDSQDRIYVADSCNHRIQLFSASGQYVTNYGRAGTGLGEFSYPYDVRVDRRGYQYVCEFGNSRLQIFDREHRPVEIIGGAGVAPGQFSNPWSIALDSHDNLYVADALNHRVQKFLRPSGEGAAAAGATETQPTPRSRSNLARAPRVLSLLLP